MSIKDALFAVIDSEPQSELKGRTLLQKKLYFVSERLGESFGYVPHYFGPHSSRVAEELGALVEAGFVDEKVEIFSSPQFPMSDQRRYYTYTLTDDGRSILGNRSKEIDGYKQVLNQVNAADPRISGSYYLLSIAAKVHLILKEDKPASAADIKKQARSYGWEIKRTDIDKISDYVQEMSPPRRE